jgi:hypothetical protein
MANNVAHSKAAELESPAPIGISPSTSKLKPLNSTPDFCIWSITPKI